MAEDASATAGMGRAGRNFRPLQLAQHTKYLIQVRLLAEVIDLAKDDRPFFVDDEDGALGYARDRRSKAQHAVTLGDLAMGIKIAAQRKAQDAGFELLKSYMAVDGVNADAHDLGIVLGELAQSSIGRRELGRSNRGPVGHVKSKHHVLLPAIILQLDFVLLRSGHRANFKFRSQISNYGIFQGQLL